MGELCLIRQYKKFKGGWNKSVKNNCLHTKNKSKNKSQNNRIIKIILKNSKASINKKAMIKNRSSERKRKALITRRRTNNSKLFLYQNSNKSNLQKIFKVWKLEYNNLDQRSKPMK